MLGDGAAAGNIAWISWAGEAQKAGARMLEEQAPSFGYCHECGWCALELLDER
jgi:hypothetical protein